MKEITSKADVHGCPCCGGKQIFRSRRRGLKDWFLHHVLFHNPYRCATCDVRFFRPSHNRQRNEQMHRHV